MRLITHLDGNGNAVAGILVGESVCPLATATAKVGLGSVSMVREFLSVTDPAAREAVSRAAAEVAASSSTLPQLDTLALLPPVPDPDKIICLALNSKAHCREVGIEPPAVPWYFPKWRNSLVGHNGVVNPPRETRKLDWEGEIAVVIDRVAKYVDESEALSYVAGIMPFNDITSRDFMHGLETIQLTKAADMQAPCGPALVTLDEIADINDLHYRTRVNGVTEQDGSTSDQVFNVAQTIASLTRTVTLVPGDIISMGTLLGVGIAAVPPRFMNSGDVVEVEVDGVGTLRTHIGPPSTGPVVGPVAGNVSQQTPGVPS